MLQLAQNTHRESVILFTLTTVDRDSTQRFCDHSQSLDMGYGTAATHTIIKTYTLETGISHVDSCSERVLLLHREFFFSLRVILGYIHKDLPTFVYLFQTENEHQQRDYDMGFGAPGNKDFARAAMRRLDTVYSGSS